MKKTASHKYEITFDSYEDENGDAWFERKFCCDGKQLYSDRITESMYVHSVDSMDLFRLVEMFSMGMISLNYNEILAIRGNWGNVICPNTETSKT